MATKNVDPISRIEGHLGVELTTANTSHPSGFETVSVANVHGNMWRGFENFLIGREPNDAIIFTQRICGVCPVPHGMTATFAAESVIGYNANFQTFEDKIPKKAVYIRNLVLAAEFIMSHLTHFYHLAAPSYVQGPNTPPWTPYFNDSFYHPLLLSDGDAGKRVLPENGVQPDASASAWSKDLWSAVIKQYVKALRMRRLTFEAGALFAGRMPTTSCYIAGGVTVDKTDDLQDKCTMFQDIFEEIGVFIFKEHVPLVLALGALYPAYDNETNAQIAWNNNLKHDLFATADVVDTYGYGAGCGNFLSWGAFPVGSDPTAPTFARKYQVGVEGTPQTITSTDVATYLKESIAHSRYADPDAVFDANEEAYPGDVPNTIPDRDAEYSWIKAPRWYKNADGSGAAALGQPMEVGPLARMVVNGWYPVSAATPVRLVAASWPAGMAKPVTYGYTEDGGTTYLGLKPQLVEADLAVALVREGLAEYKFTADIDAIDYDGLGSHVALGLQTYTVSGTAVTGTASADGIYLNVDDLSDATIAAAYVTNAAAWKGHISGTIAAWVLNMVGGTSNMDRLRGRALEAAILVQYMIGNFDGSSWTGGWNATLKAEGLAGGDTWTEREIPSTETSGFGATEAPRGALMHQITIDGGKIKRYQCIVPTTWNASPKDINGTPGPIEQAMAGVPYSTATTSFAKAAEFGTADSAGTGSAGGGVEALRVAQTFDPCIACAVH